MKIVQINLTCGSGSTGKICVGISQLLTANSIENYIIYSAGQSDYLNAIKCREKFSLFQLLRSRVLGNYGFNSKTTTKCIIQELEKISPDIVHLHNLHGHNCDLELLMSYFKKKKIKLVWTFHDCWAFTAYCPYFDMVNCDKWKTGCNHCPQFKIYSWFFDRSKWLYNKKRKVFTGLDLTIVTPSKWLAGLVKESFLKDYQVKVINNGIDLSVFKPTPSNFREIYDISREKTVILGVAIKWVSRKGADVFIELAKRLDPEKFQIVVVGTDKKFDKLLPDNIISIHRTQNQTELAEIYSAADLFVNPTREENYPTVNMEAIACGTPVITFDTGGSSEMLDETCGIVVDKNDIAALINAIESFSNNYSFNVSNCLRRSQEFEAYNKFEEYLSIYGI